MEIVDIFYHESRTILKNDFRTLLWQIFIKKKITAAAYETIAGKENETVDSGHNKTMMKNKKTEIKSLIFQ
jgi:hypothetical protein